MSLIFASVYFAAGRFGLLLASLNKQASPIWPATGLAIAILLIFGKKYWISVCLGAFAVNYQVSGLLLPSLGISMGNTLEALLGANLILKFNRENTFGEFSRSLSILISSVMASLVSASFGVITLFMSGGLISEKIIAVFETWWIGDILGGLIFMPLTVFFLENLKFLDSIKIHQLKYFTKTSHSITSSEIHPKYAKLELLGLISLVTIVSWTIFEMPQGNLILFFLFPLLLWSALLLEEIHLLGMVCLFGAYGVWAGQYGQGLFKNGSLNSNFIHFQILLGSLSITSLVLLDFKRLSQLRALQKFLFIGWGLGCLLFLKMDLDNRSMDALEFKKIKAIAETRLQDSLDKYEGILRSGVGLLEASKIVGRGEWRSFADQIKIGVIGSRGLLGFGAVFFVPNEKLEPFINSTRLDEAPNFTYHPLPGSPQHSGDHFVIAYIEPLAKNLAAQGLDLSTESRRKEAAERARDSGAFTATEPIELVQDSQKIPALLFFLPFYKHEAKPKTLEERRARHLGWVYAPVLIHDFFAGAIGNENIPELSYEVRSDKTVLVQSKDFSIIRSPMFEKIQLNLAGQNFDILLKPSSSFKSSEDAGTSWTAAISALMTLFLSIFASRQLSEKKRVEMIVNQIATELEFTNEIAKTGGWEVNFLNRKFEWSNVTRSILEVEKTFQPSLADALSFIPLDMDQKELKIAFKKALKTGQAWDFDLQIRKNKNQDIWLRVIGRPYFEKGKIVRLLGAIQDITDKKTKELLFAHNSKMASLGEMSAGVAHEINNPLTIITGKAEKISRLLLQPNLSENLSENLGKIQVEVSKINSTAMRIATIIRGLRSFSRSGSTDPMQAIETSTLVQDTLALCQERFQQGGVTLKVVNPPEIKFSCRPTQISQIILNLLNNSFDAVEKSPSPWIHLEVKSDSDHKMIFFEITDSGAGIPTEILNKMMQPFFTTKGVGKGTGLGLSISQGIARDHGGNLRYDTNCKNTRFILELPFENELKTKNQQAA